MENNLHDVYAELSKEFSQLTVAEKREEIATKLKEIAEVINNLDPIDDIPNNNLNFATEDEYLCYLHSLVYNLENKLGNVFKSISQ